MPWFVLFGITNKEDELCSQIQEIVEKYRGIGKFQLLVPRRRIMEYHRGFWVSKLKPLFPGYIFLNADRNELELINEHAKECSLLIRILKCESTFCVLDNKDVTLMQNITDRNGIIDLLDVEKSGDYYYIKNNKLATMAVILKIIPRKKRCKILINFNKRDHIMDVGITLSTSGEKNDRTK